MSEPKNEPFTVRQHLTDVIRQIVRYLYFVFGLPGFVHQIDYADKVTGDRIRIKVSWRYTVVACNNREYWFNRLTGKFDGTGYGCQKPSAESPDCILADIHESVAPPSLWGRLRIPRQSRD